MFLAIYLLMVNKSSCLLVTRRHRSAFAFDGFSTGSLSSSVLRGGMARFIRGESFLRIDVGIAFDVK